MRIPTAALVSLAVLSVPVAARAEDANVDVRSFEYLDVIETTDGSLWKGVVVEQTPNVHFKITLAGGSVHVIKAADVVKLSKQRNPDYRSADSYGSATGAAASARGVNARYERGSLPPAVATSGLRIDPEFALVFPSGDISKTETSFAPTVRLGHESLFGNFSVGVGGLTRFTYWQLPGDTNDATWTLETMVYGRAAMHVSRVAAYAGLAIGVDTNYVYIDNDAGMSKTSLGLGMNLETGVEIVATPSLAFKFGVTYHPGTDNAYEGTDVSVEYYAVQLGMSVRP
jgi:hypothetical protein